MLNPPKPGAPSLNALRAFESAARLGGFKAAAVELNVSPGAVAQQIKTLEKWAGEALFVRMSQGVRLSDLGEAVLTDFSSAFDMLGRAVIKMRDQAGPRQIRIAVLPSIAQLWLSQRLPQLREIEPDTSISIIALDTAPNLARESYDLSIYFRLSEQVAHGIEICRDRIFPVCSPSMASSIGEPSDLAGMLFLHDSNWSRDWQEWLAKVVPDQVINTSGPHFSLYSLALQEAQNGAGIVMGHEVLVRDSLREGNLVAPFSQKVSMPQRLMIETPAPIRKNSLLEKIVDALCS